jgi:hypothetical protein
MSSCVRYAPATCLPEKNLWQANYKVVLFVILPKEIQVTMRFIRYLQVTERQYII